MEHLANGLALSFNSCWIPEMLHQCDHVTVGYSETVSASSRSSVALLQRKEKTLEADVVDRVSRPFPVLIAGPRIPMTTQGVLEVMLQP